MKHALHTLTAVAGVGTGINVMLYASLGVQISGTFTGTITFEGTLDGTNWHSIVGMKSDGTTDSSTEATGLWVFSIVGLAAFRANVNPISAGAVTIHALGSKNPVAFVFPVS